MTEGLFFLLELVAMLLLVRAVSQGGGPGRPPDLGVFAYREHVAQQQDEHMGIGRKPGA